MDGAVGTRGLVLEDAVENAGEKKQVPSAAMASVVWSIDQARGLIELLADRLILGCGTAADCSYV
jgi:hypothetical protein